MSEVLKKLVRDVSTGVEQLIDYTPEEIAQHEADALAFIERETARIAAEDAKAAAKAAALAKLVALGLTEEEAAAL